MFKKLAVIVIEKADGSVSSSVGEKGEIATEARDLIREANDNPGHGVARITALGEAGVLKQRKWKANIPASVPVAVPVESVTEESDDEDAEGPDAEEIRAKLKEKGVKVPPRITVENLIRLAIENGVEV